ncbi:hypothetical protein NA56DRAFT_748726 [Hyaloscypha hepaticicola]|uniref:Uncharacterized protein n=1 Tax=Hyaloscypha hepaticicola TaxID=2082293 RepID=A0A2J6Q654_9HELO|nr:hypothetical protein NA56DRAFT_748726 [Hyaloscypha hepaticicola]
MDPLTVISLVGNIVQFVDFGSKLLSNAIELYWSPIGNLAGHHQLELVTTDLHALISKLRQSFHPENDRSSEESEAQRKCFEAICDEAAKVAEELATRLDKLKVKDGRLRKWHSLQHAVEAAWSRNELVDLKKQLSASARFDKLDQQTREILLYMLHSPANITSEVSQEIRSQMDTQMTALSQILSRAESIDKENHRLTRDTIMKCIKKEKGKSIERSRKQGDGRKEEDTDAIQCSCAQLRLENRSAGENLASEADGIIVGIEMLNVSKAAEVELRKSICNKILQSLRYPAMSHRYEDVLEAYPKTFEWAFHDPTEEQLQWSNLTHWLAKDGGVYWVNGKAGSGKSTFMKHLYDDPRTSRYLATWAGNIPLCVSTFFFWNSGNREQKSQPGLLRALLYQVLRKHPKLVPISMPELWATTYSRAVNDNYLGEDLTRFWSLRQLFRAFKALVHQTIVPLKICFVIDGLDEFDGNHEELANLFKDITKSPYLKVCLSSRPWVVFEDMFRQCPNLRLQNLTYRDIELYVMGELNHHGAFQRLSSENPEAAPAFTREILEKADGVFLWVNLVVRSLLSGIRNRDGLEDLWERLRAMPKELEPLYSHLLGSIEPLYLPWVSKTLQILRNNHDLSHSPWGRSSPAREGVDPLTVRSLFSAIEPTMQNCTQAWLDARCEDISVRLTARCAGLLELSNPWHISGDPGGLSLVRYFHRTARDFLEQETHWCKILMHTASTDFNPNVSMMRSCLRSMQFAIAKNLCYKPILVKDFFIYSYHADSDYKSRATQTFLLDKLDDMDLTAYHGWGALQVSLDIKGCQNFLEVATVCGLRGYLAAKFSGASREKEEATRLLRRLLSGSHTLPTLELPLPRIEVVSLLLDLGADPNGVGGTQSGPRSPWELTLFFFAECHLSLSRNKCDHATVDLAYLAIMKKLALAGASPPATIMVLHGVVSESLSAVNIILKFIAPKYPLEAGSVLRALKCHVPELDVSRKGHRDEVEMDYAENQARRAMIHFLES